MKHTWTTTAPIGVFDSGRGGYYTMQEIRKLLPEYDYLFYGDIARMPYGEKTPEHIREYTFEGMNWLFDQWCEIVIVACNTAASYSIRVWQATYPDKKALSVTIPGVEAFIEQKVSSVLFLSTPATGESGILPDLVYRHGYTWSMAIKPCPWLAESIEQDALSPLTEEIKKEMLWEYVWEQWMEVESIVLACTHYGLRFDTFVSLYPDTIIIDPSQETAKKLVDYFVRHPEIEKKLTTGWTVKEYRTS